MVSKMNRSCRVSGAGRMSSIVREMKLTCLVLLALLVVPSERGNAGEIEILSAIIAAKGAAWEAGDTSVSVLPPEEQRKRVGLIKPTGLGLRAILSADAPPVGSPTSIDWRSNGGNFVTPVRDQGSCGGCWAFATTAALESAVLRSTAAPNIDLNLSEQVLLSCSLAGDCEQGGSHVTASQFIRSTGLPAESCYPYTGSDGVCSNACQNWQASTYRIDGWNWVTTTSATANALKNALQLYGPLVTTMEVYSDFFSYRSGVYSHTSGSLQGAHAVLLIGYNDVGEYFIVKNSWGSGWGESGYFRIAYTELNSAVFFGQYTIGYSRTATACSYAVEPSSASFDSNGGQGTVGVTASVGTCGWQAQSNATWIGLISGSQGSGNGTVTYSVSANGLAGGRVGNMTIAGRDFQVSQNGAASAQPTGVHRFYNPVSSTHFYTISEEEKNWILQNLPVFHYEGVAYYAYTDPQTDASGVHRFYNTITGSHFYTISEGEKNAIIQTLPPLRYEGVAYYAYP
jgi:hypothetical protein